MWPAAAWLPAAHAQGYDPTSLRQRTVLTLREAFGMLPPELIVAPVVKRIMLSSDGHVVIEQ